MERDRLQSALSMGVLVIAAEIESGTMETVKAAVKQNRRLAAYSAKIVEMAGNKYITDKGAVEIVSPEDIRGFYSDVRETVTYRQMSLFD